MLRDAASLILFKNNPLGEAGGLQVLMGLRNAGHKFLPNRMVFPGGSVDQQDFNADAASPLRPHVIARLQRSASMELAAALGHAVARELEEETGLSLGKPPALNGLDYLCRAETPEIRPIRFNARFFVGDASLANGTLGGSGELEALDWLEVEAILKLELNGATRWVIGQLQNWLSLEPNQREARKAPVLRYPNWEEE